jgi:hemoglobin/transferrin/lactoferrin receptor protein
MKALTYVIVLVAALALSTFAQDRSTIGGAVKDTAGAAIAGAEVRLVNAQQIPMSVVVTDSSGIFLFDNVQTGSYSLVASHKGFSTTSVAVNLTRAEARSVELIMGINQVSAQVTVTGDTGQAEETVKIPYQVNVIPEDNIRQRVTNVLAQVADEEPGAALQRTSPTIGAVLVRGLTEVGVYVDGVRYTNSTQRGGINTFFNLNEPTALRSVEIQRSPNTAQYGSDGLGGNVQLISRQPQFGFDTPQWNGEYNTFYGYADHSFGANALASYGTKRVGLLGNIVARRVNTVRPGDGIDSHSAITRFLGLPSNVIGEDRLPDTAFTQYGGTFQSMFALRDDQTLSFRYQRSQQDGGKRYDQLLGGDGNLIAELGNLMLDFGYLRYFKVGAGIFDNFSATVSHNSQREERINQGGQGNFLSAITNDRERTGTWGISGYADRQWDRNTLLVGADLYHDKVNAPSYSLDPVTRVTTITRPRVPNGSTYHLAGVYVQDVFEAIPDRLRLTGSLRWNHAKYRARATDAPVVNGQPLFPDDSSTYKDYSGRVGASVRVVNRLHAAFNFSRGFRAPNITSLGGLGLVGVGFQVATSDALALNLGAAVGTTGDATAVNSGVAVTPLRSEVSNNYDFSLRFSNKRVDANFTTFVIDYEDTIVRQTLILQPGAVGRQLGSQTITSQNAAGAVFVPASTTPVLVQSNFSDTRMKGVEFNIDYRINDDWQAGGNFSIVDAADKVTGAPPNLGGGGIPPALGLARLRYEPSGKKFWIEGYINAAGDQDRLSTLDIADRRTGGARTRTQIQNFFRRGACVRGLTTVGTNGQCGTAGGTLVATGETLAQVQDRILPIGATINGVLVVNNDTAVPLFAAIPGYVLFNLRGGFRFADNQLLTVDFENIGDKSHRAPGWGIDGPGRNLVVRYQYRF